MKVKASISYMSCPDGLWLSTKERQEPKDIPEHLIIEVLLIWEDVKGVVAKNVEVKGRLIDLYNTIYNENFKRTSNCPSCLKQVFNGITKIYNKYKT